MTARARWRGAGRRVCAVVGLLSALLCLGVALAPAASAVPLPDLDCKDAPTPEVPGRGVVGFFSGPPEELPPPGDPFAADSTTSIYEQYGYAGLRWNTYDLGCGPDVARSPDATVGTAVSNWVFGLPKAAVAATGALLETAYNPQFLSVFDDVVVLVVDTLRRALFEQGVVLVLTATGALLIWRARRASLSSSAAAVGWALLVLVLATALFRWPLVAGQAADAGVAGSMNAVVGALNGSDPAAAAGASPAGSTPAQAVAVQAVANLHESLLYEAWLGGMFGDSGSEIARRYGPEVFDAQALTWREAAVLADDPARGQEIVDAKKRRFEEVAGRILAEDPDAYEYLTGRRSDTRMAYASLSFIAVLCAVPFLIISCLLIIGALLIVRLAVMLFPAVAVLAIFPSMRGLLIGLGNTVAAALVNCVIFGIGTAVMVRTMGVIMSPEAGLSRWLVEALLLILTVVMWTALRPFRRLTHMVVPDRVVPEAARAPGEAARGAGRWAARTATTAAVVASSGGTAAAVAVGAPPAAASSPAGVGASPGPESHGPPSEDPARAEGREGSAGAPAVPGVAAVGLAAGTDVPVAARAGVAAGAGVTAVAGVSAGSVAASASLDAPGARADTDARPGPEPRHQLDVVAPQEIDGDVVYLLYRPGEQPPVSTAV